MINPKSISYQQSVQEAILAFDSLELPPSTFNDILRGVLVKLSQLSKELVSKGEAADFNDIYWDLVFHGLANFTLRNNGGKYADNLSAMNQVMEKMDPEWSQRKEELKNIGKGIIVIADYIEDSEEIYEYLFSLSAALGAGLVPAFISTTIDKNIIMFILVTGAIASGIVLGILCDIVRHLQRIHNLALAVHTE